MSENDFAFWFPYIIACGIVFLAIATSIIEIIADFVHLIRTGKPRE